MWSPAELPLVVEPTGLDVDVLAALARRAAASWALPEPELLRVGMNAVFAAGNDVVLRVTRPTVPAQAAIDVSALLAAGGVPVPAPVRPAPFVDGDLAVLAFERVHDSGGGIDWERVGAAVRRLHGLDLHAVAAIHPVPWCTSFPWWRFGPMLDDVAPGLDPITAAALRDAAERHRGTLSAVRSSPPVLLHGDVHPGNVIQTSDGPVLIDWDLLCAGPAGWDHAPLMTWSERWGGAPGIYEAFATGYGTDLRGDAFAGSFAELRLLAATLMRIRAGRSDPAAAAEAERRLRWWRGDPDAPSWRAM